MDKVSIVIGNFVGKPCDRALKMKADARYIIIHLIAVVVIAMSKEQEIERGFVHFQKEAVATSDTYLLYHGDIPDLTQFTICFRLYMEQYRMLMSSILSYSTPDFDDEFHIRLSDSSFEIECCNRSLNFTRITNLPIRIMKWISICIYTDLINHQLKLVFTNLTVQEELAFTLSDPEDTVKVSGGGTLIFGQDQDWPGGGFDSDQSLRGILTDFFITESLMKIKEMEDYVNCELNLPASKPLISFQNDFNLFESVNVHKYEDVVSNQEICGFDERLILLPSRQFYDEAHQLCFALGGKSFTPRSDEDTSKMFEVASPHYGDYCMKGNSDVWIGVTAKPGTAIFREYPSNNLLNYTKSKLNIPAIDGHICVAAHNSVTDPVELHGTWFHKDCIFKRCPMCRFVELPFIKLKGLCETSIIDTHYFIAMEDGDIVFRGATYSTIYKRPGNPNDTWDYGMWELIRSDMPDIRATTKLSDPSMFPIGRHEWDVKGDYCDVMPDKLTLTICDVYEFTCADGSCISLKKRCDLEPHCEGGEDEEFCKPLGQLDKYAGNLPPPRIVLNEPLNIFIAIEIYSIRSFDLKTFAITMDTTISLIWFDSRLKFHNLKEDENLNNIIDYWKQLWKPALEILGDGNTTCDNNVRQKSLHVLKKGKRIGATDEDFLEDELFEGSDNPIVLRRKSTLTTICAFHLGWFPFDTQDCKMTFFLTGISGKYVKLKPSKEGLTFLGTRQLLEYSIDKVTMEEFVQSSQTGLQVRFIFKNLVIYYVIITFIPTLIMLMIGCLTFFFTLDDFQDRIMVALTSLLVESAFFTQVSESMPKTAYLKYVDIWFVFCIIVLFIIILFLTLINFLYCSREMEVVSVRPWNSSGSFKKEAYDKTSRNQIYAVKINAFMRWAVPISILAFVSGYTFATLK